MIQCIITIKPQSGLIDGKKTEGTGVTLEFKGEDQAAPLEIAIALTIRELISEKLTPSCIQKITADTPEANRILRAVAGLPPRN